MCEKEALHEMVVGQAGQEQKKRASLPALLPTVHSREW
jgi:hypothetical protein